MTVLCLALSDLIHHSIGSLPYITGYKDGEKVVLVSGSACRPRTLGIDGNIQVKVDVEGSRDAVLQGIK